MRRLIIEQLITVAINADEVSSGEVVEVLLNAIKELNSCDDYYSIVLQKIMERIRSSDNIDVNKEWSSWIGDFVKKRLCDIPESIQINLGELRCVVHLLYYLDQTNINEILSLIKVYFDRPSICEMKGHSLLIAAEMNKDLELSDDRRLAVARAFEYIAPKSSKGQFYHAEDDLRLVIYKDSKPRDDVFDIIKRGVYKSVLNDDERVELIRTLEI